MTEMRRLIIALDSAFKTGRENDFSCIQTWGESKANAAYYLLANWRGRVEFPELKSKVESFFKLWKPEAVVIEDCASGQSLLQVLKASETPMPLKPFRPDRDKVARANAIAGYLEAGKIFIPAVAPWLADFEDEVQSFPFGLHDDQVDTMTMALGFLIGKSASLSGWLLEGASRFAALRKEFPATHPVDLLEKHPELSLAGRPSPTLSLGDAQMQEHESRVGAVQFKRTKNVFGELERNVMQNNRVTVHRTALPDICPSCGNSGLSIYESWRRCGSCNWDSRNATPPAPEPKEPERKPERKRVSVGKTFQLGGDEWQR